MPSPITPLVDMPSTADPSNFDARADNLLNTQFPRMIAEINAVALALSFATTNASSVSTLTIMLGEAELDVDEGKAYLPGMTLKAVARENAQAWMLGEVESYNPATGELVLEVRSKRGVGTYSDWVIFMAAAEQLDGSYVYQQTVKNTASLNDYLLIADMAAEGGNKRLLLSELLRRAGDVGDIKITGRATASTDWLLVPTAPTNLSRTAYPELWAAYQTIWGDGDGATTFGLPWLAPGHTVLQSSGNVGARTPGAVIAHTHAYTQPAGSPAAYASMASNSGPSVGTTGSTGGSANLAAGAYFNLLIKYR